MRHRTVVSIDRMWAARRKSAITSKRKKDAFILPAWVGAGLISLSTVIVALNAHLLRRLDLREAEAGMAQSNVLVARSTTSDFLPPRVYLPSIQQ